MHLAIYACIYYHVFICNACIYLFIGLYLFNCLFSMQLFNLYVQ